MAGPEDWGAVPVAAPQPSAPSPQSWGATPMPTETEEPEQPKIPDAFIDRLTSGEALKRALKRTVAPFAVAGKGFAEGFGSERLGLSEEHTHQFRELTGNSLFLNTLVEQGAVPVDALLRTVSGGVHAVGALVGHNAEELEKAFGGDFQAGRARSETINALNYLMMRGDIRTSRLNYDPSPWGHDVREQPIGTLPKDADFDTGATILGSDAAKDNLRTLWEERGIHPAEAVHDAQKDAWQKQELTSPERVLPDRSGIPPVQGSSIPEGTPRSELARTSEPHIDAILDHPDTKAAIDSPVVNRTNDVPYSAGADKTGPELNIDRHFPESFTIDGVTFDPADPFAVHEFSERDAMERLIAGGIDEETAYRVAHYEVAEKAEGAWYTAHGINQADAEAAYQPFIDAIDHEDPANPPPNLYTKPYPHSNVRAVGREPVEATKPTAEEIARAKKILAAEPEGVGEESGNVVHVQPKAARGPRARDPETWSLLEYLASRGGISPDEKLIGDVRGIFDGNRFIPGFDHIIRKGGMSLDRAREAAVEGGYIFEPGDHGPGERQVTISHLLEAMDRENRGDRIYRAGVEPPVNRVDFLDQMGRFFDKELHGAGIEPSQVTPAIRKRVLQIMEKEGEGDPLLAWERAVMEETERGAETGKHERIAEELPGWDVPDDAGATPGASRNVEGSGERGTSAAARAPGAGDRIQGLPEEVEMPLRAIGAEVSGPLPSLAEQPAPPPGRLMTAARDAIDKLFDIGRDIQMKLTPMAAGSSSARALAKDFANALRRNRWEWSRVDADIEKRFNPEQRKRMWDAADEESVARQLGESTEHQGLVTLTDAERSAVDDLQRRAQVAWLRARDMGMVEGEGLPAYTPRMVINTANAASGEGAIPLNGMGRNLRVKTPQMRQRKYLTAEETEAAAKAKFGEEAEIARDIRALPLATGKLEDAIAGRTLIDAVRDYGNRTGADTVAEGFQPDASWFTLDHPAFRTWRPKFETDPATGAVRAALDANGNPIFQQVPLYIHGDFEGPLRAVLMQNSGAAYGGLMRLKGIATSLIMNSPMIHNWVEFGRSYPGMKGNYLTPWRVYFQGNRAKNDVGLMREAIDNGLVPIGKRFFNQDITSIMEAPDLTPGRNWEAKVLGFIPDLFTPDANVTRGLDKAFDFWHNSLLWDRIADLQMGLYTTYREDALASGVDRQSASRMAAHWANRYAGALPKEAMSDGATKVANLFLFSRTFTLGNLGVLKDVFTGLPKDVLAQIERDAGVADPKAVGYAKSLARRKATAIVALDAGLFFVGNSLLQSAINVLRSDSTLDEELHGYANRFWKKLHEAEQHPLSLLSPMGLLAQSENEPTREDRLKVGYTKDGTAIYARNPAGKIGEEFIGWMTGPLDMIRRKLGTIARPGWQILSNDKGFGRKVYDPNADTPAKYLNNALQVVKTIAESQVPTGQLSGLVDLVKGEGDKNLNMLQTFGPLAGITFSKGAPGGPAIGELYAARTQHQFAVDQALPDIRKQIQRGDIAGAQRRMTELGIAPGLQRFYIRTSQNPATRLSPKALRDFYLYATPEQRDRLERARQ
jgi:hypothetical protein